MLAFSYYRQIVLFDLILQSLGKYPKTFSPAITFTKGLKVLPFPLLLGLLPFSAITRAVLMIPTLCLMAAEIGINRFLSKKPDMASTRRVNEAKAYLYLVPTIALFACLAPALTPVLSILPLYTFLHHRLTDPQGSFQLNPQNAHLNPGSTMFYSIWAIANSLSKIFITTCFISILAPLALSTTPILAPIAPMVAAVSSIIGSVHPLVFSASTFLISEVLHFIASTNPVPHGCMLSIFISSIYNLAQQPTRSTSKPAPQTIPASTLAEGGKPALGTVQDNGLKQALRPTSHPTSRYPEKEEHMTHAPS